MRTFRRNTRQQGAAMAVLLTSIVLCAAISAAAVGTGASRRREARTDVDREKAFQLAEAGIDWGISQVRILGGAIPGVPATRTARKAGSFTVRYTRGNQDQRDDDGDGTVDELDESDYVVITATGESGLVRRTLRVLMRRAVEVPTFDAVVQLNVEAPIFDLSGNSFAIDGRDHLLDGTLDPYASPVYGIAGPALVEDVEAQIASGNRDQITGLGPTPSIGQVAPIDLTHLMEQAAASADTILVPGSHEDVSLGDPATSTVVAAYCAGDLHLSGNVSGAGVLTVDGDLFISGGFQWTGIVMVRGRVRFTGGGGTKRVLGVLAAGEEVVEGDLSTGGTGVTVRGNVDVAYCSEAVALASERLSMLAVVSWNEVGNP